MSIQEISRVADMVSENLVYISVYIRILAMPQDDLKSIYVVLVHITRKE